MIPLEFIYYSGYLFDKHRKLRHQRRLPYKVISIGNITIGGTGKTPATIAIAEEAKKRGFYPIILTRGYKGKAKGPCFVNVLGNELEQGLNNGIQDSKFKIQKNSSLVTRHSSLLYGDEPILMAWRLKDIPIVKCSDRYKGGMFAIDNLKSQLSDIGSRILFILDDGFQHWKLYRDIDIVLIDGSNPFGNRRLLPIGPLREPLSELKRADMFVVTKMKNEELSEELKYINPKAPVYFSEYKIHGIRDIDDNEYKIEILSDKKIFAFSGIANPDSFIQTVRSLCKNVVGFKAYRDHHQYSQADIIYLMQQCNALNCDFLLTTEKDIVKIKEIQGLISKICNKNILSLKIDFCVEPTFFDGIFNLKLSNY